MALKFKFKTKEEIPAEHLPIYTEREPGQHILRVTHHGQPALRENVHLHQADSFNLIVDWFAVSLSRLLRLTAEARACRLGSRGEQAVAEALGNQSLAAAGYISFHDVPGNGAWNIDHVVVGPAGVFVIETKTRSRRKAKINQEEHVVTFDGRTFQFPWCEDRKAASQVNRNVDWVRKFLAGFGPKDLVVQPILVVPGWYTKSNGNYPIMLMNQTYLTGFLSREPKRFLPEQLQAVLRRFDERSRDLEF